MSSYTIRPSIQVAPPSLEPSKELRAKWSVQGGPVIGFSGRFVQEKRPDLLIKALDVINTKYPNARIVFAGQYDIPYEHTWQEQQALVKHYKDQLIFLGLLTDDQDMADFYAAIDVLVLPSDTECFALVQVEAMLCGTPVVMTDIPGGRVPVRETGIGKLARKGDFESIGAALIDVLNQPEKYRKPREFIEQK